MKTQAAADAKKLKAKEARKRAKEVGKGTEGNSEERGGEKEAGMGRKRRAKQPKRQRRTAKRASSPVDTPELVSLFADLDIEDNGQCLQTVERLLAKR